MESILKFLLEKYIEPTLKLLWKLVWCLIISFKKLAFPLKDLRTGIKQSRMRYYLVQFSYRTGEKQDAYQEVNSNGNLKGYYDGEGKRFIPEELHECSHLDTGKFQFPKWGRIDWRDVFNGNNNSGCWGISEK